MLDSWKKAKVRVTLLPIHNIIIIVLNRFRQVFIASDSSR